MSVRYDKKRNVWIADYYDRRGRRHQPTFDRKREATAEQDEARRAVRRGAYLDPNEAPFLEDVARAWLKGKGGRRPSSIAAWEVHVLDHIVPELGDYRITDVKVGAVEAFRDELAKKLAPQSVNKVLTTLAAIFKDAMRRDQVVANPAAATERLRIGAGEIDLEKKSAARQKAAEVSPDEILTPEQTAKLIDAATPGYYRMLFTMLAATGVRIGEATALTWPDVDLDASTITIRRGVSHARTRSEKEAGEKARPRFFAPKTPSGFRTLPIAPEIVSALRRWKLACPPTRAGLVFPSAIGAPAHRKTIWERGFRPALDAAKLPHVTLHSLRHTFASSLIMRGVPVTEVAALLGHKSSAVTTAIYAHWFKTVKTDSVASYTRALFSARDSSKVAAEEAEDAAPKVRKLVK